MVRIFFDRNGKGEYVIQTTCLEPDVFLSEFSEALAAAVPKITDGTDLALFSILSNAMPIAYRLSGYKAENVQEERMLYCGKISPGSCEVVSSAGR